MFDTLIIGGGAAGFFAASNLLDLMPECRMAVLEKTGKLLSKVIISGGGRCNVTHHSPSHKWLSENYPRGRKELLGCFYTFGPSDTMEWFRRRGVPLYVQEDQRVFPQSDQSKSIADCLMANVIRHGVEIQLHTGVQHIQPENNGFTLTTTKGDVACKTLLIASGGHARLDMFDYMRSLNHRIIPPVPSLFTFNTPSHHILTLQGLSVPHVTVHIGGIKHHTTGALLITHWGLSGPAVLKLSSIAALELHQNKYVFDVQINFLPDVHPEQTRILWRQYKEGPQRKTPIKNLIPPGIPKRLWHFLLEETHINPRLSISEVANKSLELLGVKLHAYPLRAQGKTTFKEEFVTAGGVATSEVDFKTMQSKHHPGLFFAGEILNIDGVTGGFNFQAAWTTAYMASHGIQQFLTNK